jgi:hypothetical protein
MIGQHVLLPWAREIEAADARLSGLITPALVAAIVAQIPDAWLADEPAFASVAQHRAAYEQYFCSRLAAPRAFVQEAVRAAAQHV